MRDQLPGYREIRSSKKREEFVGDSSVLLSLTVMGENTE
jgi:hypothetical protein